MDYRQARVKMQKGVLHSFYLFNGPEEYLKEELLQEILSIMEKKGESFYLEKVDGSCITLDELLQSTRQSTIFSEGKIVWVYNPPYFSAAKKGANLRGRKKEQGRHSKQKNPGEAALLSFIQQKAQDIILIISAQNVDKRKKTVKAIEQAGLLIEFPPPKGAALMQWLKNELSQQGKKVEEEVLLELLARVGEDLYLLKKELEKIITYMGAEKVLSRSLVKNLVPESRQSNIFHLVEALGSKNVDEAFEHLLKMRRQNEHPLVILTMIIRQFRLLYQVLALQRKGIPPGKIAAFLKIPPFALGELLKQVNSYDEHELAGILLKLKQTDLDIKTGRCAANDALEQLILCLAAG